MEQVVVGVVGGGGAEAGLVWALGCALLDRSEVVAAHVLAGGRPGAAGHGRLPEPGGDAARQRAEEADAEVRLEAAVKAARALVPADLVVVGTRVLRAPVVEGLLLAAASADLLVLTRRHVGALDRAVHGSVTRRVLQQAACGVAVVPADWRPSEFRGRVLVGVDRSGPSLHALSRAADEAARRDVPLVPVLVRGLADGLPGTERAGDDRADLERWCAQLGRPDRVLPQVVVGTPGPALVDSAGPDDLLVLGRPESRPATVAERVNGSAALHAVRHATCPVLLAPPA